MQRGESGANRDAYGVLADLEVGAPALGASPAALAGDRRGPGQPGAGNRSVSLHVPKPLVARAD